MIKPPFTNRWGTKPGPDYRQCAATTAAGNRCRRGATRGFDVCEQHMHFPIVGMIEADLAKMELKVLAMDLKDSANNDPRPKRALERVVPKQSHKPFRKKRK